MKKIQSVIYLTIVLFLSMLVISCASNTKSPEKTNKAIKSIEKYKDDNSNNIPDFLESDGLEDSQRVKKMDKFLTNRKKDKHYNSVKQYRNDLAEKIRLKARKGLLLVEEYTYKITDENLNLFKNAKIYEMENDLSIYELVIPTTNVSTENLTEEVIIKEPKIRTVRELYRQIILPTLEKNKDRVLEEREFLNLFKNKIKTIDPFKFYFIDADFTRKETVVPFELANLQLGPARIQVENYNKLIRKKVDDKLKKLSALKSSLSDKYRIYNNKVLMPLTYSYSVLLEKARKLANINKIIQGKEDEVARFRKQGENIGKKIVTKAIYWGLIEYGKNKSKKQASTYLENRMKKVAIEYYAKWNTQVSRRILNDKFVQDTIYREQSAKIENKTNSTYSLDQYNYKTDKPVYSSILNLEIQFNPSRKGSVGNSSSTDDQFNQFQQSFQQIVRLTMTNVDSYNIPDSIKESLKSTIRANTTANHKAILEAKKLQIETKKKRKIEQHNLAKFEAMRNNLEEHIERDIRKIKETGAEVNQQCTNLYSGHNNTHTKESNLKNGEGFVFRYINSRQSEISQNSDLSLVEIKKRLRTQIKNDFKSTDIAFYLNEEVFEGDEEINKNNKKLEVTGSIEDKDIENIFVTQKTTDLQNNKNIHNIYGLAVHIKANINVAFNIEDINLYNEQEGSKELNKIKKNYANYFEKKTVNKNNFINYCFNQSHDNSAEATKEINSTNVLASFNEKIALQKFLKQIKNTTITTTQTSKNSQLQKNLKNFNIPNSIVE